MVDAPLHGQGRRICRVSLIVFHSIMGVIIDINIIIDVANTNTITNISVKSIAPVSGQTLYAMCDSYPLNLIR